MLKPTSLATHQMAHRTKVWSGIAGTPLCGPSGFVPAPHEVLTARAADLLGLLGSPGLLVIDPPVVVPCDDRALVVGVLIHGDEHSGWIAAAELLRDLATGICPLARRLIILIGNVFAAAYNRRFLDGQRDFNRIWKPGPSRPSQEESWAQKVVDQIAALSPQGLFAVVDLHNNSGRNPCYACVARLRPKDLDLARLFSPHIVHFEHPDTTLGAAMAQRAPSVTLEAGPSGCPEGLARLGHTLRTLLVLPDLSQTTTTAQPTTVFRNRFSLGVDPTWQITMTALSSIMSITAAENDMLWLREDIDILNFVELTAPTPIGRTSPAAARNPLWIRAVVGQGSSAPNPCIPAAPRLAYHVTPGGLIVLKPGWIPAMLSPKPEAIRADCLGYLMEHLARE